MPRNLAMTRKNTPKKQFKQQELLPATDLMKAVAMKAPVKKRIDKVFSPEEVAEIYDKIAERKSNAAMQATAKTKEEVARRERTIKVKKQAKEMEKGNQSRLILFPSYSRKKDEVEWYKMGNFSALYYVYRMADRMGRSARLMRDTDKFGKMVEGVASIRNIDKFLAQVARLNEFDEHEVTLDGIYIIPLIKPLTDEEVGILRRTEAERREMMHNVLRPKRADAAIYQSILLLDRQVLPRSNKMPKGYYETIGQSMALGIKELTQVYFAYAEGRISVEQAKSKLLWIIDGLRASTALLGENSVWTYDVATSVGENVAALKKLVSEMK